MCNTFTGAIVKCINIVGTIFNANPCICGDINCLTNQLCIESNNQCLNNFSSCWSFSQSNSNYYVLLNTICKSISNTSPKISQCGSGNSDCISIVSSDNSIIYGGCQQTL